MCLNTRKTQCSSSPNVQVQISKTQNIINFMTKSSRIFHFSFLSGEQEFLVNAYLTAHNFVLSRWSLSNQLHYWYFSLNRLWRSQVFLRNISKSILICQNFKAFYVVLMIFNYNGLRSILLVLSTILKIICFDRESTRGWTSLIFISDILHKEFMHFGTF